jgi:Na+-translocating ferredoxin:NAD+ oxidoreductase RnfA subunit
VLEKYLENTSHIVAGLTAALVCFSVIHDYSYFSVVGKKYFSMMGVWDHVSSALENTLVFFVAIVVSHTFRYISDEKNFSARVKFLAPITIFILPISGIVLMVGSAFLREDASFYESVGFLLMTVSCVFAVMDFFRVNEKYRDFAFQVGFLVLFSYSSAELDANRALYRDHVIEAKYTVDGDVYKVLKSFSLGFVAKKIGEDKVVFRSWDGKTEFEGAFQNEAMGWACKRYDVCMG